jgi:hypothetical protein
MAGGPAGSVFIRELLLQGAEPDRRPAGSAAVALCRRSRRAWAWRRAASAPRGLAPAGLALYGGGGPAAARDWRRRDGRCARTGAVWAWRRRTRADRTRAGRAWCQLDGRCARTGAVRAWAPAASRRPDSSRAGLVPGRTRVVRLGAGRARAVRDWCRAGLASCDLVPAGLAPCGTDRPGGATPRRRGGAARAASPRMASPREVTALGTSCGASADPANAGIRSVSAVRIARRPQICGNISR